ncbi:MAG: hypothetical protein WBA25_13485, partial [Jannaschia sp.]
DYAAAPPSGSAHAAVEPPRSGRARTGLIAAVAVIALILLVSFFFAGDDPESVDGAEDAIILDDAPAADAPVTDAPATDGTTGN